MQIFISLILNLALGLSVIAQSQPRPCCCLMQVLNERPTTEVEETLVTEADTREAETLSAAVTASPVIADTVEENLPPCCRGRADAAPAEPGDDSSPCQCRFQFEEGARLEASSELVRLPLLPAFEFVPLLQTHLCLNELTDTRITGLDGPGDHCATLPVRTELCIWRC